MDTAIKFADLSDEKLTKLIEFFPVEARAELARRGAYETIEQAVTNLYKLGYDVEERLAAYKGTEVVRELKKLDVGGVISRVIAYAEKAGVAFDKPELVPFVRPVKEGEKTEGEQKTDGQQNGETGNNGENAGSEQQQAAGEAGSGEQQTEQPGGEGAGEGSGEVSAENAGGEQAQTTSRRSRRERAAA